MGDSYDFIDLGTSLHLQPLPDEYAERKFFRMWLKHRKKKRACFVFTQLNLNSFCIHFLYEIQQFESKKNCKVTPSILIYTNTH